MVYNPPTWVYTPSGVHTYNVYLVVYTLIMCTSCCHAYRINYHSSKKTSSKVKDGEVVYLAGSYQVDSCDNAITSEHGRVNSPEYPNQYPINAVCSYHFNITGKKKMLYLGFEKFDLVNKDSLIISEYHLETAKNDTNVTEKVIDRETMYYGSELPDDLISTSQYVDVAFNSTSDDASLEVGQGFLLAHHDISEYWHSPR